MIIKTKNNKQVVLSRLNSNDFDELSDYLQHLSIRTKKRFGPHQFDKNSIIELYKSSDTYFGYVAHDIEASKIIAYSIIKIGYLDHDKFRLESYGMKLDKRIDCAFAPSVGDRWQSAGIGNMLFQFIVSDLKCKEVKRVTLWGGVQLNNEKAVNYYLKNGFKILGQFNNQGENYDMSFEIN